MAQGSVLDIEGGLTRYYHFILNNVMLYTDMSLWAENNDKNQIHNPTIEYFTNGLDDNVFQQYSRNAVHKNHGYQLYSGIGTFTQCKLSCTYFYYVLFLKTRYSKFLFVTGDAPANRKRRVW